MPETSSFLDARSAPCHSQLRLWCSGAWSKSTARKLQQPSSRFGAFKSGSIASFEGQQESGKQNYSILFLRRSSLKTDELKSMTDTRQTKGQAAGMHS